MTRATAGSWASSRISVVLPRTQIIFATQKLRNSGSPLFGARDRTRVSASTRLAWETVASFCNRATAAAPLSIRERPDWRPSFFRSLKSEESACSRRKRRNSILPGFDELSSSESSTFARQSGAGERNCEAMARGLNSEAKRPIRIRPMQMNLSTRNDRSRFVRPTPRVLALKESHIGMQSK